MYIAIVDDLKKDREHLRDLIAADCADHRIPVEFMLFPSGEAFLDAYRPGLFASVFLDIVMGSLTGIDVAKTIRKQEPRLPIILTTSEPGFALEGFAVHVMDYLLKPIAPEKLAWCLEQLRQTNDIPVFLEVRETSGQGISRPVKISLDDILYLRADGHSVVIRTLSDSVRVRSSFRELIPQLPANGRFFECGRGVAVNFSHAKGVESGKVLMKNGEQLLFSVRQQAAVEQAYMQYIFSRTRKGGWV